MERLDGRTPAQLRPVTIEMGFQKNAMQAAVWFPLAIPG